MYCPKFLSYQDGLEQRRKLDKDHDHKEKLFKHTSTCAIILIARNH